MNKHFKEGFEKRASVTGALASMAGIFAMPSLNKRIVSNTIERSKLKSMGFTHKGKSNLLDRLSDRLNSDLNFVESLPKKSLRKKINSFLMAEGPGAVFYTPAKKGRELGQGLNRLHEQIPMVDKQLLANITSSDSNKAVSSMKELAGQAKSLKTKMKAATRIGLTIGGSTLAAFGLSKALTPKKERQFTPPLNYTPNQNIP